MPETNTTQPYVDPRVTALLVVDMQKGFCHPESRMAKAGASTENQRAIIPNVIRLVEYVRTLGIPIVFSTQIHFPEDVTRGRRRIPGHHAKQRWTPCLRDSWEVELMPEIKGAVEPTDFILEKHRASCFFETTLDTKLRMLGIEQVLISGCNTEFCVETTIRDAYYRDLDVIVLRDCVASSRLDFHDDTLRKVEAYFGVVLPLDELPEAVMPVEGSPNWRPVLGDVLAEV
jgi:ureidoacrylate peracid hydrolase